MSLSTIFAMIPFDGQLSKSTKDANIFALALTVSDILICLIFNLLKLGEGKGVTFSR